MKAVILGLPDDEHEVPAWLERQLVGPALEELVAELSEIVGNAPEPEGVLRSVLGDRFDAVLSDGLKVLPEDEIQRLLARPGLLLQLRDEVLDAGGEYWDRVADSVPELRAAAERERLRVETRRRSEEFRARAKHWARHPAVVSLATAAAVLAAVLLPGYARRPAEAPTDGGYVSSGDRLTLPRGLDEGSLPKQIYQRSQRDAQARGIKGGVDTDYLTNLADEFRRRALAAPAPAAGEPEASDPLSRVFELRQLCSELLRPAPGTLEPRTEEAVKRVARDCAKKLDAIRDAFEDGKLGGDPDALRKPLAAAASDAADQLQKEAKARAR
jgi:hypothetical protein